MRIRLENYNPEKHAKYFVANLIYKADKELHLLEYGEQEKGIRLITKFMSLDNNYLSPPHIKCVIYDDEIVGVIVGFQTDKKAKLDIIQWKDFPKAMGFLAFLKKLLLLLRMAKLTSGKMDKYGYYILILSISFPYQRCGFGNSIIDMLTEQQSKLYLHVNINNTPAQKFYKKVGFRPLSKHTIIFKGKEIGTYLMKKE